jgi:hypothetical protein
MMRSTLAAAVAAMVAVAAPATAAPVSYDINFENTYTTGSQAATPSGSFTYNSSTETFSAFKVIIRGVTFDLTADANSPVSVLDPCIAGKTAFDILAGTTGCTSNQVWAFLDADSNFSSFDLFASPNPFQSNTLFMVFAGNLRSTNPNPPLPSGDGPDDGGTFTITARNQPVPVPEPTSIALIGLGLAGLAATRRRATLRGG